MTPAPEEPPSRPPPQTHDTPTPQGTIVLRISSRTRIEEATKAKGDLIEALVNVPLRLTTEDEKGTPPYLSVWCSARTTPEQARDFVGGGKNDCYITLPADDIRQIRLGSDEWEHLIIAPLERAMDVANLGEAARLECRVLVVGEFYASPDVRWFDTEKTGPGSDGHCGITELEELRRLKGFEILTADAMGKKADQVIAGLKGAWRASRKALRLALARRAARAGGMKPIQPGETAAQGGSTVAEEVAH